ncbi:MAG: hypothetical protein M5U28_13755 [Sandaracinaceae bacterium]|nr:hypothetical protein [Sandaracinaceae bacterium]
MSERADLPGGIALPATVLALSAALFVAAWRDPELIDLGPHLSAAGIGVLGCALSFFWLLVAVAKRRR